MTLLRRRFLLVLVPAVFPASVLMASETPAASGSLTDEAQQVLQQLLLAYAGGDLKTVESLVDPKMIGHARVVDAARDAGLAQKQMRLSLLDVRSQLSDDNVLVQTRWEKRYLSIPARTAILKTGTCTFVMHAHASAWRLIGLQGDSPFGAE